MKKYKVNVNGTNYEIAIELIDADAKVEEIKTAPAAPAAPAPEAPAAPAATAGNGETVNAPMPGNILAINVNVGDTVSEGQVLMILEAMKMENEIMAPKSGKITSIGVTTGAVVESGAVLCTIE